ncbi:MAG: aminotransferase class IV [Peptostreptococcaceae bacterium]|nr:aminotransferase class IV [Peptostreptococcaceae bacterium]
MIKDNAGNKIMIDGEIRLAKEWDNHSLKGTSIYEVLRIVDGKPLFLKEHIKRFVNSFYILRYELPEEINDIEKNFWFFLKASEIENGNIKIICDGIGEEKQRVSIYEALSIYPEKELYKRGVAISVMKKSRTSPGAKKIETSLRMDTDRLKLKKNVYEVLLIDEKGNVTEGSRSNIFFIKNGILHTPPIEQVLPGITRMKVLEFCEKKDIEVKIHTIKEEDINYFDGAFLTGTSINMLPVKEIDKVVYSVDGFAFELSHQFESFIGQESFSA